jgi:acetoin utilization deacetylase AcuC-like enzyme
MGFCLFSNVAIATRWAQSVAGVGRVLIVDFDVHHGNGTQDIFYEDTDVMYMSVHQAPFYPGSGDADERGTGDAVESTVNVPLQAGAGDDVYLYVFREILRPRALHFDPELIFISAGYDAHWKDPLGGMQMTTKGFAELVRELSEWADTCCDGRLIAALEGGYHLNALAHSVIATLDVLNDGAAHVEDPIGSAPGEAPPLEHFLRRLDDFFSID